MLYRVNDTIVGEVFETTNKEQAELDVERRLEAHNSTWYGRRFVHESENAISVFDTKTHTYTIKHKENH